MPSGSRAEDVSGPSATSCSTKKGLPALRVTTVGDELRGRRAGGEVRHQLSHVVGDQRSHRQGDHPGDAGRLSQPAQRRVVRRELGDPARHQQAPGRVTSGPDEVREQVQGARVGPVQVLHDQAERRTRRRAAENLADGREQPAGVAAGWWRRRVSRRFVAVGTSASSSRASAGGAAPGRPSSAAAAACSRGRGPTRPPEERHGRAQGQASADEDGHAGACATIGRLLHETALPDAGVARHQRNSGRPGSGHDGVEVRQLGLTADERRRTHVARAAQDRWPVKA